jgi:hypothetical protein
LVGLPLEIRSVLVGTDTYVFTFAGELDAQTALAAGAELARATEGRTIVDLLGVTFADAAGLAVLHRPKLSVVADRAVLRRIGGGAGLTVHPTLAAAMAAV